jgi:hypothetical protein
MATIITRETGATAKSSPLSNAELDNNFINLNSDIATRIPSAEKGAANGVATLDGSSKVPSSQLPSYVDDVLEYANLAALPQTGETGKIYVALDTNKTYRWGGTTYTAIASGNVDSVAGKTGVVTLVKADVGLSEVDNKSSTTIRSEITSANIIGALGFTPLSNATSYLPLAGGTTTGKIISGTSNGDVLEIRNDTSANASSAYVTFKNRNLSGTYASSVRLSSVTKADGFGGDFLVETFYSGSAYKGLLVDESSNVWFYDQNNVKKFQWDAVNSRALINNNVVIHAGNYSSYALPITGGTTTGVTTLNSNFRFHLGGETGTSVVDFRLNTSSKNLVISAPDTGAVFLNWDHGTGGVNFGNGASGTVGSVSALGAANFIGAITQNGSQVLHAGNYTSYSPGLTGSGASGTWGISISGNAATASTLQTARLINGQTFNGSTDINTTEWYHSGRDFVNGTLITTGIDYSASSGDPFVLQIRGNSYGSQMPFDIQLQGYIYADTIINYGAYSTGPTFPIILMNVGGKLCFWFARQTYWQGFNANCYTAYGTRALNKVESITDIANPNGTKQVTITPAQVLRSDNFTNYAPGLTGSGASGTWNITAATANALNTGNNYTGNQFTASGSGYFFANRPAIANQAGIQFQTAGTTNWWNFLDNNVNTLTWYQSATNTQVMTLTQAGVLNVVGGITQNSNQVLHAGNYGSYLGNAYMRAIGPASSSNDWNTIGNSYPNTVQQVDPTNFSSTTNGPTAANYTYGTLVNLSAQSSSQAQIYISHAGNDLIFRGGWGGSSWQAWNKVLTNQNYSSYALPLVGGTVSGRLTVNNELKFGAERRYYVGNLTTGANPARYEIARVYIDYNDWHSAGTIQVELQNNYYMGGDRQVWNISFDYNIVNCDLVESIGPRGRFGTVTCGSPVQVSGDSYYLPVYVDVRYYGYYYAYVTTSWPEVTSHGAHFGAILVYTSPSSSSISDFTPSDAISLRATSLSLSGNGVLHAGNYTSYAPSLTGSGASGTWGISISGNAATASNGGVTSVNGQTGAVTVSAGSAFTGGTVANATTFTSEVTASSYLLVNGVSYLQTSLAIWNSNWAAWNVVINRNSGTGLPQITNVTFEGSTILHAGNYNSYALPLSGGTVTGSTQIASLGVGTAASGTAGEIRATNNITAYYSSDSKFKENIVSITNASEIVDAIGGKYFDWTDAYLADHGGADGYFVQKSDFGVVAQDVLEHFPRAVRTRPDGSLAVDYEKLSSLAFAAISEQHKKLVRLEALVELLLNKDK